MRRRHGSWIPLVVLAVAAAMSGCGDDDTVGDAGPDTGEVSDQTPTDGEPGDGDTGEVPCECTGDSECDDGDPCNGAEQCTACACVSGIPAADGTGCNDGDACTSGDACAAGVCTGEARDCDDGNPCTDDTCDAAAGCGHANNALPCDDGDPCTEGELCAAGACGGGTAVVCDDGNPCTDDACDPSLGCVGTPNTAGCDDGSVCTTDDVCADGSCAGTPIVTCDDGNPCTDDACDPATGSCTATDNTAPCDDGDPCTESDACAAGSCVPGSRLPDWYPDADGDTFGDREATPVCGAAAPDGHVADFTDCCDTNDDVFPGQTAWFVEPYNCGSSSSTFDYNCNDTPDMRYTVAGGDCTRTGTSCVTTVGWVGSIIRTCGGSGSFVTACSTTCAPVSENRPQECH